MRKRLTARNFRAETQADGLFPGDIGNEERAKNYHDPSEFSNYDFQPGWDTQDPNAPKINDERDEIGFGIPKTAKLYRKAKCAAILAQMYLGDEAPEKALEDQARDFMKMDQDAIVSSIRRWKATEEVAPEQDKTSCGDQEKEVKADEVEQEKAPETADANAEAPATETETEVAAGEGEGEDGAAGEEVKSGDEETACDAVKSCDEVKSCDQTTACDGIKTNDDVSEIASGEEDAPEMNVEIPPACDQGEITSFDDELKEGEADPQLQALFAGEEPEKEVVPETTASVRKAKKGIKHLAGQPKLASSDSIGIKELQGLWTNLKAPGL